MLRENKLNASEITFDEFLSLWDSPYGYLTVLIRCAQIMSEGEDVALADRSAEFLTANLCLQELISKANGSQPNVPSEVRTQLMTEIFPDAVIQLLMEALNATEPPEPFWSAPGVIVPKPAKTLPQPQRTKSELQPRKKRAATKGQPKPPKKTKQPKQKSTASDEAKERSANPDGAPTMYDTIGLYLKQMGEAPLLTAQEEIELATRIEIGEDAAERRAQLWGQEELSEQESDELVALEEVIADAQNAREHLARANTRLVVSIAKRYIGQGLPFPDLIQEGNVGLMRAVDKFDAAKGNRFSTYATWWIRQVITRSLSDTGKLIRVPVHKNEALRKLYKIEEALTQDIGHRPSVEELSLFYLTEEVGEVTEAQLEGEHQQLYKDKLKLITGLMEARREVISLDMKVGDDEDAEFGEFVADESMSTEKSAEVGIMRELLRKIMDEAAGFSASDQRLMEVLRLRYGLDEESGGEGRTLEEVGNYLGVTRERARQLEAKGLKLLRQPKFRHLLRDLPRDT